MFLCLNFHTLSTTCHLCAQDDRILSTQKPPTLPGTPITHDSSKSSCKDEFTKHRLTVLLLYIRQHFVYYLEMSIVALCLWDSSISPWVFHSRKLVYYFQGALHYDDAFKHPIYPSKGVLEDKFKKLMDSLEKAVW